jgi:hypothetical protein
MKARRKKKVSPRKKTAASKKRRAAPKKRRAAPKKRRASKKRAAAKRAPRRAKRKARRANMTEKQSDKRYKRRSQKKKARKNNPARKRRASPRRSKGRKYGARRKPRRDNPLGLRLGNPTGNWGNIVALGVASLGGYIAAEFLDRFVATRAGGKSKDAFTGATAIGLIHAPPDGMRMAAQGGLSLLFLVGGFWAAKKKHDTIAYAATGAGIGAGLHLAAQIWYDNVVPMFAEHSKDPANPSFLGDRIYPDLDKAALKKASDAAKALRTAGHSTLGAPQQAPQAPQYQATVQNSLAGTPRVVSRPAPVVGCGAGDMGASLMLQQQRQQIAALSAQVAAMRSPAMADGPEHVRHAPPASPVPNNVSLISKRFAAFA